jgi:hypothetical protein
VKKRDARKLALRFTSDWMGGWRGPDLDDVWEDHPDLTDAEAAKVLDAIQDIVERLGRAAWRLESADEKPAATGDAQEDAP